MISIMQLSTFKVVVSEYYYGDKNEVYQNRFTT